jgi:hypothetical protein
MYVPSVGDPDAEERLPGLEERIAAETRELERRARGRVSGGPSGVRYVFIGGCPRSGTTALTTFMNCDPRIPLAARPQVAFVELALVKVQISR